MQEYHFETKHKQDNKDEKRRKNCERNKYKKTNLLKLCF